MTNLSGSLFSQVIDGRQYNAWPNWYSWNGGRFITNLNIPKVQATTGRDTGAIYYRLADSSVYVWSGSSWRQITGSGGGVDSIFIASDTLKYTKLGTTYVVGAIGGGGESGELIYFLEDEADGTISGYKVMNNPAQLLTESTVTQSTIAEGQIIQEWITDMGLPNVTFIPDGVWNFHINAFKTGGSKEVRIYNEIYKRNLAGTETLLGTTANSIPLTGVETALPVFSIYLAGQIILSTDRIVTKTRMRLVGGGSDPTSVTLGYSGTTAARLAIPAQGGSGGGSTDTTSLSNRINLKLNISDTAAMLNNYVRLQRFNDSLTAVRATVNSKQGALTLTTTGSSGASTLIGNTLNIPQYSGGGGGSADSSWVSTETGTQYTTLGTVINTTFASGTLPSGWADVTPTAGVTVSAGKIAITGGVRDTGQISTGTATGIVYTNRIETGEYYNYNKLRYRFRFVPQTKNSTSFLGFTFLPNSLFFSTSTLFYFNLSDNADSSGKVVVRTMGTGTTFAVSNKLAFSVGDTLEVQILRIGWQVDLIYTNRTTGAVVRTSFSTPSPFGTGGKSYFAAIGGSQDITAFGVDVYDRSGYGITYLGDSQTAGAGATTEDKTFPNLVIPNVTRYSNLSNGSATLSQMVNSHVPNAIALNNPYVVITAGYNDRRDLGSDTTTFRQRYDSIVQPIIRAGLTPILMTLVPAAASTDNNNSRYNVCIVNLANSYGLRYISIDSVLKIGGAGSFPNLPRPNMISTDGIHLSDSAQILIANLMRLKLPELDLYYKTDTTSFVKLIDLPTGTANMEHVVVDAQNNIYKYPYKPFDGVPNSYSRRGVGTFGDSAQIHLKFPIRTDSTFQTGNSIGLVLDFNGGTNYDAGSAGSRILISNRGVQGTGYPFAAPTMTGLRQIVFEPLTIKSNTRPTHSGDDLFLAAFGNATGNVSGSRIVSFSGRLGDAGALSGSDNVLMSYESGRGITTGSNNFHAVTRNPSGASFPSSLTGSTVLGDMNNQTGGQITFQNYDVWIGAGNTAFDHTYRFGGLGGADNIYFERSPTYQSTNRAGTPWYFRSARGYGSGAGGSMIFQTWNAGASGTTINSVASTELYIKNQGVAVGNVAAVDASAQLEVVSTTKGFLPPRMTAAQASAIGSPAEGLMVYVTDTNGTFTSKGWWGYNGAAWEKLNN